MKDKPTNDSKYIQQHLANERTFLAWIRTAITIVGVGYLAAKLHFLSTVYPKPMADRLAQSIGLASVLIGMMTVIYAILDYLEKRKTINAQTFRAPSRHLVLLGLGILVLSILLLLYLLFM